MATIYIKQDKEDLPKRKPNDQYQTEESLIWAAMRRLVPPRVTNVLDIGAGDGRWGRITQILTRPSILVGVEVENYPKPHGFTHWYNEDFLTWEWSTQYSNFDLIVSNPPYYIAEEIVRKAWDLLVPGGSMIMLMRLAFQASIGRYQGLWNEIWPTKILICSRRPSFYGGGTNGTEYGIYYWWKDNFGKPYGIPRSWQTELLYYERAKPRG